MLLWWKGFDVTMPLICCTQLPLHYTEKLPRSGYSCIGLLFKVSQVGFNSRYWLYCHPNLRVSRTKIENLRCQVGENINFITFGKLVTLLVQKLKKKCAHKNCESRYWLQISLFTFFLKFLGQWCYKFSEGYPPLICHLIFSIFVLGTLKFKKKGLAM